MKYFLILIIRLYQKTISLDTGWFSGVYGKRSCRFHPTCSQYTLESIERFGSLKGGYLGFKRILRCHPWSKGGIDKVPEK